MRCHRLALVLAWALLFAPPAQGQSAPPAAASYDTVFTELKNLAPRPDRVASVHGVVLRRDVLELHLDSGSAYLLTPVAGRTVGIAFVGTGSVSLVPPLAVERFNLQRVLGDSTITGPIAAAVFIFADSTQAELARSLQFGAAPAGAPDPHGAIGDALDYLVDGRSHAADPSLLAALLNETNTGYFAAYIQRTHGESVMMQFDPTEAEEVLVYRRGRMIGQRVETVCQFQRAEDLARGVAVASEQPEPLAIDAYDIDATIDGNYKFSARSTLRLSGRRDPQRWALLRLYSELDVDSVTSGGQPLAFYRRDRWVPLWVRFPKPVGLGDTVDVRVVYHGNLITFGSAMDEFLPAWSDPIRRQITPLMDKWAFIKSTETWYPRYSFEQSAAMALTFHTPRALKFATIGRLVDSVTDGNVTTTHWVSELPTNQVSFNIGEFEQLEIRDPRIPPVTVHVNAEAHRAISHIIPHAGRPEENVGADIANSLSFFTRVFGPPLFRHYYATEIPYFHGQAFPGMIHLSWWTYVGWSTQGNDESFRAHEMAHQWWGIGVEPASYRDVWLAEGFAEFAGLWYMQIILRDNEKYLKKLREARQAIRRERGKAAPIGLGQRASESWRGHYELITYEKGAWVLHMLRNMMLDVRTMSEDRFMAMMRDFYTTYRGQRASTLDFQRTVESHFGQPMDWFFDEWVYGTAVPTYTFSWTAAPDSAGYVARVRVRQSDVPDRFTMYVPVLIKFDQGEAIVRVLVRGATTEGSIHLPAQPISMQLNPLESVLADVKTEAWEP
jgi:hypothetical protein